MPVVVAVLVPARSGRGSWPPPLVLLVACGGHVLEIVEGGIGRDGGLVQDH